MLAFCSLQCYNISASRFGGAIVMMGKDFRRSVGFLLWCMMVSLGYRIMWLPLLNGYIAPGNFMYPALIFSHTLF